MLLKLLRKGVPVWTMAICLSSMAFAQHSGPQTFSDYRNSFAPYVGTPQRAVDKMLEMASLKPGETLYDLGCGDGRILIAAAQRYKIKAVGVEISDRLVKTAQENVKNYALEDRIKIIHGNIMQTNLSDADVVTLYLITTENEVLRPNLEKYLKKDARVISYDYPIPGWKPVEETETDPSRYGNRHTIYLYQVPISFKK